MNREEYFLLAGIFIIGLTLGFLFPQINGEMTTRTSSTRFQPSMLSYRDPAMES
jgi:hypothetical protein